MLGLILTVLFMQIFDFVNILSLPHNGIVVKHIAISQSSQFRTWKLAIFAEIETMNCNTSDNLSCSKTRVRRA